MLSPGVPDDDPRRGSKHVGLINNSCDLLYENKLTRVHLFV
jgi:hypothetical protein